MYGGAPRHRLLSFTKCCRCSEAERAMFTDSASCSIPLVVGRSVSPYFVWDLIC